MRLQNEKLKNLSINLRMGLGQLRTDADGCVEVEDEEVGQFLQDVCKFVPAERAVRAPRGLGRIFATRETMNAPVEPRKATKEDGPTKEDVAMLMDEFDKLRDQIADTQEENRKLRALLDARGGSEAPEGDEGKADVQKTAEGQGEAATGKSGGKAAKGKGPKPE